MPHRWTLRLEFREEIEAMRLEYVAGIQPATTVWAPGWDLRGPQGQTTITMIGKSN
jgi:hypothetical protein